MDTKNTMDITAEILDFSDFNSDPIHQVNIADFPTLDGCTWTVKECRKYNQLLKLTGEGVDITYRRKCLSSGSWVVDVRDLNGSNDFVNGDHKQLPGKTPEHIIAAAEWCVTEAAKRRGAGGDDDPTPPGGGSEPQSSDTYELPEGVTAAALSKLVRWRFPAADSYLVKLCHCASITDLVQWMREDFGLTHKLTRETERGLRRVMVEVRRQHDGSAGREAELRRQFGGLGLTNDAVERLVNAGNGGLTGLGCGTL